MSLQPATYAEALERAQKRPQKPRTPLRSRSTLKASHRATVRKRKSKKRKLTTGQLKKKAWKEFSIFIRTRGADSEGFNKCVTCGVRKHWKELQAGHFLRGRLNSNLFNETGCWAQCYSCNVGKQGNVVLYYKFILAEYGQAWIDHMIRQNDETRKWQPGELETLFGFYQRLNAANPLLRDE